MCEKDAERQTHSYKLLQCLQKNRQWRQRARKKSWTRTFFWLFKHFFFYHYLSIKSKELIHTISFCTIYIYCIYIRLWKGREASGVKWKMFFFFSFVFTRHKGKVALGCLNGADRLLSYFIFFCLNAALGGNLLPRAILRRAIGITKWSLWTKGTFKGQPLTAGNLYTTAQALKVIYREGAEQGRGSLCSLLHTKSDF